MKTEVVLKLKKPLLSYSCNWCLMKTEVVLKFYKKGIIIIT